MSANSTALAIAAPQTAMVRETSNALEPRSFDDGMRFADMVAKSGMYGVKSQSEAFVRIATGMSLGLDAGQSLRSVFVIGGKPGIYADAMMGLCLSKPVCEYFRLVSSSDQGATFEAKRRGDKQVALTFSFEDAERAGLLSNNMYKKYPARMFESRAKAMLARLVFPDVCAGIYTPEELTNGGAAPDIETAEIVSEAPRAKPIERQAPLPVNDAQLATAAELEMRLADVSSQAEIDDLKTEYGPKFHGPIRKQIKALFDAATERVAEVIKAAVSETE